MQSGGTVLFVMIACDFVLPKRNAFLLCSPKMDPVNSVLRVLPSCFVVKFSGFRKITTVLFFFFGTPRVQLCEEHCVSGFTTFSPSCDDSSIQYGCQNE